MARSKRKARRNKKPLWRRLLLGFVLAVLALAVLGVGAFIVLYSTTDVPEAHSDFQTNTTFIQYADGEPMSSLAVQNRQELDFDEMPQVVKDAVVAAENRSFWTDPGFSIPGMARGAWSIATGGEVQGGSTITQQYIKILYLDSEQTVSRKVRELMLAIKLDREMPKEEILEGYLNTIYFGRGAYGIQAAANSFFLKDASELTVSEAAALAAIFNNPAAFNPSGGPEHLERLHARYQYVLNGMLEMGTITEAEYAAAYPQLPEFPKVPINDRYGGPKGHLIHMVEQDMEELGFPADQLHGGGLTIITTVKEPLQARAVEVAQQYTQEAAENGDEGATAEDLHVALASVDTATGAILAMYGGPDYVEQSINWATTPRAAASTFKTYAVIAGLRQGFGLDTVLNGNTFTPTGAAQTINNQGRTQYGPVTMRRALADSINTAFVDLTQQMDSGPRSIEEAANDAGAPTLQSWDDQIHSLFALGFADVSPLNIANSYATLANSGQRNDTYIVQRVEDRHGSVLYEAAAQPEQTIERDIAATTTSALTSVVDEGTGRRASALNRPVAGKTGTNQGEASGEINSGWFVGTTKQVSTAVMYVAGEHGVSDLVPYRAPGNRTFFGSGYPLMTWLDFMEVAMDGLPVQAFDEPSTPVPTREPSPTQEPTPTEEPTTESPTPTPSESPTPTPSETPTTEPTREPEPTEEPEPEPTDEPGPTSEPPPDPPDDGDEGGGQGGVGDDSD